MAAGALLNANPGMIVSPEVPQVDNAVAPNFERFDGLTLPTDNPATADPMAGGIGTGAEFGYNVVGAYPRPGAVNTPVPEQVYTPGPLKGTVGVVGGQPRPTAGSGQYREVAGSTVGGYTPGKTNSIQQRLGVGQNNQGAAQTVQLSEITSNPPQPGDLSAIIAGLS